ncbi:MAG: DUF2935 domain-containing protein [Negativicutes bacterium]|nr:DUF2935 domain-containing protein [Negativicutes bacterium]
MHEVCFWLRIMQEHALFICLGLPCEQSKLREEAQKFGNVFEDLGHRARAIHSGEDFSCFVKRLTVAVKEFFIFKRHILHLLIECKICGGGLSPLFVDHLSREALYFFKLLNKICDGEMGRPVDAMASEDVFWLRIMADHLRFIRTLVDPSERQLGGQLKDFSDRFDQLGLQARDLASQLWHFQVNDELIRFTKEVTMEAVRLRDFKAAVEKMISDCAAVSCTPPLLADHFRREADHFLTVLERIREALLQDETPSQCCSDYD